MPSGDSIGYAETQNMLEGLRLEIDQKNATKAAAIGGFSDLQCIPPWPVTTRREKQRCIVGLKISVPFGTNRVKVVLEEYSGSGSSVTVHRTYNDSVEVPESLAAVGGVFDFDYPSRLDFSTKYGCLRLVAVASDGSRILNPESDPPAVGVRNEADYLPGGTFVTPDQFGTPSAPDAALIAYNERDYLTPDQHDAHVGLIVYAPLTDAGAAQSYLTAEVDWVRSVLERTYPAEGTLQEDIGPHLLTDTELAQVADGVAGRPLSVPPGRGFVIMDEVGLKAGATYTWIKNVIHTGTGKASATGSVAIIAGNQQGDLTQLTNTSLTVIATDPYDSKHVQPIIRFTQPAVPVGLRNFTIKLKKSADVPWKVVGPPRQNAIQSDAYNQTVNAGTISGNTGSAVITGVGTQFTRLEAGWEIKVGAQTLIIADTPSSDTSLSVVTNPASNFSASAYTIVFVVAAEASIKVKPSTSYNLQALIRARSSSNTPLTLSASFTTDADGNVIMDTAVPNSLATPSADWTAANRLRVRGLNFGSSTTLTNQSASLKKKYLVIYDGTNDASTKYLDIVNRTSIVGIANEASARFEFGLKSHITLGDIKKKIYSTVFGASGGFYVYWYAENDIGVSSKSSDFGPINVASMNEILSDDLDAVRVIDAGSKMGAPQQIVDNGDFGFGTAGSPTTNLNTWRQWDKTSVINNANTTLITTTSADLSWDVANHKVKWDGNGHALCQRVRGLVPGEFFTLTFYFSNVGVFVPTFPIINISLVKQGTTTDELVLSPTISTGGATTPYILLTATMQLDPTATGDPAIPHWLVLKTSYALSGTKYFFLDRIMFERGKIPHSFMYSINDAATVDFSNTVGAITSPDVGTGGGVQSGHFEPGTGGGIFVN